MQCLITLGFRRWLLELAWKIISGDGTVLL